jgi:hypothetical protein
VQAHEYLVEYYLLAVVVVDKVLVANGMELLTITVS